MSTNKENTNSGHQLILLHPDDNILVTVASLPAGTEVDIDGSRYVLSQALAVGHKMARRTMAAGEKIFKYGAPIGSLTQQVAAGEWVHMHNMQSDYLASHTRQSAKQRQP
ncbi:MAG TPA: UxaA family hydrolase [Cellvibrionaceae bacterium]